jgi:hypothetical protein
MLEVLKEFEFFWGIVVGLLLSFIGAWAQAKITVSMNEKKMKKTVINFCLDTIRNLQKIIKEMDESRDRTKVIFHDFLTLIEVEVTIYGRNREHMINLPETERNAVRQFMTDCAVKRAEIASKLDQFYRLDAQAKQVQAEGRGPEAQRIANQALAPLHESHQAADRLVDVANKAPGIVGQLEAL